MNIELASDHQDCLPNEDHQENLTKPDNRASKDDTEDLSSIYTQLEKSEPKEKTPKNKLKEELQEFFELANTRRRGSGRIINM